MAFPLDEVLLEHNQTFNAVLSRKILLSLVHLVRPLVCPVDATFDDDWGLLHDDLQILVQLLRHLLFVNPCVQQQYLLDETLVAPLVQLFQLVRVELPQQNLY